MNNFLLLFISSSAFSVMQGCVHVAPYEREYLARPSMNAERESDEIGFKAHIHDSREGSSGGHGSTGGGCGCN